MSTATPPSAAAPVEPKASGPFAVVFPPNLKIWEEARRLVADPKVRLDDLADLASRDPAIVVELIKTANSMAYSQGRPAVTTIKNAIERLGESGAVETFDAMKQVPQISDAGVSKWFEVARMRCARMGRVARIVAESVQSAKVLGDDIHVAGVMIAVGEMVAVLHFGPEFVKLADANPRTKVLYRLEKDSKFSCDSMSIAYLRRKGVPELVLFAIDPEAQSKLPNRGIMKPVCAAASEFVLTYEAERWAKIAPGQQLQPKSNIRMLNLDDQQYETLYTKIGEYLISTTPPGKTA